MSSTIKSTSFKFLSPHSMKRHCIAQFTGINSCTVRNDPTQLGVLSLSQMKKLESNMFKVTQPVVIEPGFEFKI